MQQPGSAIGFVRRSKFVYGSVEREIEYPSVLSVVPLGLLQFEQCRGRFFDQGSDDLERCNFNPGLLWGLEDLLRCQILAWFDQPPSVGCRQKTVLQTAHEKCFMLARKRCSNMLYRPTNEVFAQKLDPAALASESVGYLRPRTNVSEEFSNLVEGDKLEFSAIFQISNCIGDVVSRFHKVSQWMSTPSAGVVFNQSNSLSNLSKR